MKYEKQSQISFFPLLIFHPPSIPLSDSQFHDFLHFLFLYASPIPFFSPQVPQKTEINDTKGAQKEGRSVWLHLHSFIWPLK